MSPNHSSRSRFRVRLDSVVSRLLKNALKWPFDRELGKSPRELSSTCESASVEINPAESNFNSLLERYLRAAGVMMRAHWAEASEMNRIIATAAVALTFIAHPAIANAARQLMKILTGPTAIPVIRAQGMEPAL